MFKCTNYFLVARRRSIEISRLFRITSRSSSSLSTTLFFPTSATSAISFVPITTFPSSGKAASTSIIPTTSIIPSRDSLYLQWNTIKENLAEIYGEIRCTLLVNLEFSICIKNTNTSNTNPLPMAGLQGILPTASRFMVRHTVSSPIRAAASAASMPACPAPMTAISNCPAKNSFIPAPHSQCKVSTATCGWLKSRGIPPSPRVTKTCAS